MYALYVAKLAIDLPLLIRFSLSIPLLASSQFVHHVPVKTAFSLK